MRRRKFSDKWVFIGTLLDKIQRQPLNPACFYLSLSHLPSFQTILLFLTRRKRGIFPFTFYSGKQGGILVAVQTRSPIARGNWVDIGNESKEQITWSKGRRALRWSGGTDEWRRDLRRGLCANDGSPGVETATSWSVLRTYVRNTILRHSRGDTLGTPSIIPRALLICLIYCFLSPRDVF